VRTVADLYRPRDREDLVAFVNKRAKTTGAPVQAVFCQAQLHLDEIFGDRVVDRVYLNFPDPWFKRRHHNRRMIDAVLAAGIVRIAAPGAELFVQSDVWEIALDAMGVLEREAELVNSPASGRSGAPAIRTAHGRGASSTPRRPGCRSGGSGIAGASAPDRRRA